MYGSSPLVDATGSVRDSTQVVQLVTKQSNETSINFTADTKLKTTRAKKVKIGI